MNMKAKTALLASIAAVGISGAASAATATGTINFAWPPSPGTGTVTGTITLPDVTSIKSITVQLASTWASDLDVFVDAPGGALNEFELMDNEFGNSDLGLVAGSGALANVAPYTFVAAGGLAFGGTYSAPGTYTADAWPGVTANVGGVYTLSVTDAVGADGGAVGTWTIEYNPVPTPGALALLGMAGLFGARGRRRQG